MMYARIRACGLLISAIALLTGCPPNNGDPDTGDTGVDQTDTAEPEDAGDVADTADGMVEPVDADGDDATDAADTDQKMPDIADTTPSDSGQPDTTPVDTGEPDAGDAWQPEGDAIAWCEMQNADAPDCPGPTQPPMGVVCDQLDTCCKNMETGQVCRYETRCHIPAIIENDSDWACAP